MNAEKLASALECTICQQLFLEPITTSCGHTFCKTCILRVSDYDNKCPLCRRVILVSPDCTPNVVLMEIIQSHLPEQLIQRKQEAEKENGSDEFHVPLFLLGDLILFPGGNLPLHVFEPRYLLMIRRCLEGSRTFGIVPTVNGELQRFGTTVFIENYWHLPDGRMLVMCSGSKRFRVLGTSVQDNYSVAKVSYFFDKELSVEEQRNVDCLHKALRTTFSEKFSSMKDVLEEKFGTIPNDLSSFSFWLASAIPCSTNTKLEILGSDSVLSRLEKLNERFEHLTNNQGNCNVS